MDWIWVLGAGVLTVLAAGFGVWKRMRDDYPQELILEAIWRIGLAAGVGAMLGARALNMAVWGALAGGGVMLVWYCRRRGWDGWEWADVVGRWSLGVGVVMFLAAGDGVKAAAAGIGWVVGGIVARNYRRMAGFINGRPGLVGLVSLVWWAGSEGVVAMTRPADLYWGGSILPIALSGVSVAGAAALLWRRR